jgi:hypothetical protein
MSHFRFLSFQVDKASSVGNDTSGKSVALPLDVEALKDNQPELTATTSTTVGEGVPNIKEDRNTEESKNGSRAELLATSGRLSNTESEKGEFLFSE